MASIITGAAHTAHSTAASLLSSAQIHPGKKLPPLKVKETSPEHAETISLTGTSVIVGVPGAFTGTCSTQIPGYIDNYEAFKAKGVTGIYVVAINDQFVMNAWKEKLAPEGTAIHFLADDQGEFSGATGLIFDATPLLGGPRSKRYAMIVKNQEVASVAVEEDPSKITVTDAKTILAQL
ncbi:Redoxin [Guyanagaster necrorhizus]|uniref:Redoxin n=1 Tax=Guyanagaster necrorhizus TaxID=856835 RepID=A0A9P8APQ9_9AGAR|nr:Redoxin [Guyanagaster necrorhizus MCA 3950]KAG7442117.1 Redoxin [Guyanagaster necrorhizus MCA 3950]